MSIKPASLKIQHSPSFEYSKETQSLRLPGRTKSDLSKGLSTYSHGSQTLRPSSDTFTEWMRKSAEIHCCTSNKQNQLSSRNFAIHQIPQSSEVSRVQKSNANNATDQNLSKLQNLAQSSIIKEFQLIQPSLSVVFSSLILSSSLMIEPETDLQNISEKSTNADYPVKQGKVHALETNAIIKELNVLRKVTQRLQVLTQSEYRSIKEEPFTSLALLKVEASDARVPLEKLKMIKSSYFKLLIEPICKLNQKHFQEIVGMFDMNIPFHSDFIQSLHSFRSECPVYWQELVQVQGMVLGDFKKLHGEMLRTFECIDMYLKYTANDGKLEDITDSIGTDIEEPKISGLTEQQAFDEIKKTLLYRNFNNFFNGHPLIKEKSNELSLALSAESVENETGVDFSKLSTTLGEIAPVLGKSERSKGIKEDIKTRTAEVDRFMESLTLFMKLDRDYLKNIVEANRSLISTQLNIMHQMEQKLDEALKFLDERTGGKLSVQDGREIKNYFEFFQSNNQEMAKSFASLGLEYWRHKTAFLEALIKSTAKSPAFKKAIHEGTWQTTILEPAMTFCSNVRNAVDQGNLNHNDLLNQNEFMVHLLALRNKIDQIEFWMNEISTIEAFIENTPRSPVFKQAIDSKTWKSTFVKPLKALCKEIKTALDEDSLPSISVSDLENSKLPLDKLRQDIATKESIYFAEKSNSKKSKGFFRNLFNWF